MPTAHRITLIILNWNNAPDTLECLASLQAAPQDACRLLVVDNGSGDDSVQRIRQGFPAVTLLETGQNLGYAGGNNVGIRYALDQGADLIGILNNDVKVAPDFLAPLAAALHHNQDAGIATPLVAELDQPDNIWALGQTLDRRSGEVTRLRAGEPASTLKTHPPLDVEIASGTAMLIKRAVIEQVGVLDEKFFLYYEETDWCLRVRQSGFRILAVPASVVWHAVSHTLGTRSPVIDYYMLRNHLRFISRHWSGAARARVLAFTVLRNLRDIAAYTAKPHGGARLPHRNARVLALRDAALQRWGPMGADVARVCGVAR